MRMMDAIVKPAAAPGLELRQVPVPTPGAGEVLIKVHKTAICGTDVHIYDWNVWSAQHVKPPMVIGHEYVGEIAELGAGVTGLTVGQRVSGEGHITCGHCRNCHTGNIQWCKNTTSVGVDRDGAFAEYVCIPARNVVLIDPALDEDVVAMFDAVGNATHTALMFNLVGEDVLITGAGPVGILAVAIAKYAGARRVVVTDLNDYRLGLALKMGADAAINSAKQDLTLAMKEQGLVEGFDVGFEMSGSGAALHQMIGVMRNGGTGRHLIQKQDLVAPQTQDVADDGLQPLRALAAPATDIVVQQHPVLDHPVAQAGGQRRIPAVQLIFGDGALQAAVRPCVGAVHLHQDLQSGLSGVRLSHVAHTVTCTGWPAR